MTTTAQKDLRSTGVQRRALTGTFQRDAVNADARTVQLAWASEEPYERWFGMEVLDCATGSVRLDRLMNGAPLLFNHDPDELIGVVESVSIGQDRVCRATVRFGTTEDADEAFTLVQDGILRNVSVGYCIHAYRLEGEADGVETYRVTDWEPLEISMVSVPADPTVGVGRGLEIKPADAPKPNEPQSQPLTQESRMTDTATPQAAVTPLAGPSSADADVQRRDAIIELGVKYSQYLTLNDVQDACRSGKTPMQVQDLVMERMTSKHSDTRAGHIGLSERESGQYSIARAVGAMISGDWSKAGLEKAAGEAASRQFGMSSRGILVPFDVLSRTFTAGGSTTGQPLIENTLRTDLFADVLRNNLALGRLGATTLYGLSSNVDIPKKTAGSSLGWITEVAGAAQTDPATAKISLSPKRIGAYVDFSKQAVIQSSMAIEPMLRADINAELAVRIEDAAINGTGASNNPKGLRYTSGIGSVIGGTNGAQVGWSHIVALETACAAANAEPDQTAGYMVNTKTRGWTKTTQKANALGFVWENGDTPLNGYRAAVTNTLPSNLTKGSSSTCSSLIFGSQWDMLVIGTFGAVEILLDEISQATNGLNRLVINAYADVGVRRAANFAVFDDALTS